MSRLNVGYVMASIFLIGVLLGINFRSPILVGSFLVSVGISVWFGTYISKAIKGPREKIK